MSKAQEVPPYLNQQHLHELLMQLPAFVSVLRGPSHLIELCNEQYKELVGKNRKLIGRKVADALPEVVEQGFVKLLDAVYASGQPHYAEAVRVQLDKNQNGILQTAYVNFTYSPFKEGNEVKGIIVHGKEVTQQVQARQDLQASEKKYRSIFETIDQGLCIVEMIFDNNDLPVDYRFVEVNPTFNKQSVLQNVEGKRIKELVPQLEQKWLDIYGNVSLTGKTASLTDYSKLSGRWFDINAFRIEDNPKGKVAILFTDTTERVRAKEALVASESRVREELKVMFRLHELVITLMGDTSPAKALEEVLNATLEVLNADKGCIHLYSAAEDHLRLEAQSGLDQSFISHFAIVDRKHGSTSAAAMAGENVLIGDVNTDPAYRSLKNIAKKSNYRAVYSIPLMSRENQLLGVVNIYYTQPQQPTDRELRVLDLFTRQAADFITLFQVREEIKNRERQFKTYIEALPQMAFIADKEGNVTYFNERWYNYVGNGEGTEGWGWKDKNIIHSEEIALTIETWSNSLKSGLPYEIEYRLRRRDGKYLWHLGRAEPVVNEEGKVEMWLGTMTNIHTQKLAEEALRKSEEYYKTMTDNTPVMTWITDPEGTCTYLNKPWFNYTGQKQEEGLGYGWLQAVHPEDSKRSSETFKQANQVQKAFTLEYRLKDARGNYRWHIDTGLPKFNEEGDFEGFIGSVVDIHERKMVEDALRESEEYSRTLVESSPDCVKVLSYDGNILSMNSQGLLMHDIDDFNEVKGVNWLKRWEGGEYYHKAKAATELARQGKIGHFQGAAPTIKGTFKWWDILVAPVYNREGKVERLVAVSRDISNLKKLEQQKDDFLGIASHELKTPVTSIKAYGQVLKHRFENNEDRDSSLMLEKMDQQLDKLNKLIADLLDVTKVEQGKFILQKENFDFNQLVGEVVESVQHTSEKHRFILNLTSTFDIIADRERIGQVMINFLSNAIKYTPAGGKIKVNSMQDKDEIVFSVEDRGIGLSAADQLKVFERFYRVEGETAKTYPGLGLGLFISRQIIERHEGKIWVESKKDKGSTFYFSLPFKEREETTIGYKKELL
jgi:PAS domain S-box-containing protein